MAVRVKRTYIGSGWSGYNTNTGFIGKNHSDFDKTLSSKQFSTLIDVLSEGVIEGSATASKAGITNKSSQRYINAFLKDIFLDDTQILLQGAPDNNNVPDSTFFNYKGVDFEARYGTNDQSALNGVVAIQREEDVGVEVKNGIPVVRTINDQTIDAVRVTVAFPELKHIQDNGDVDGELVDIDVQLIQGNNTTTTEIADTVIGKSNDAYFRDYIINLPANCVFPIQIKVIRGKANSTNPLIRDKFIWSSYTEITNEKNRYLDVAHTKLRFDSSISPTLPSRKFRIRGIKIKIPDNATVDPANGRLTYSGNFNGLFKADKKWCSDPAWILYDILTNDRYGAGLPESSINKYALYSASVYCNELIDDGLGGKEPRYSCNVNLNNSAEAYDLINDLCTTMNVMPYYSEGSITISQDRPQDPTYQFTLANVLEGGFTYSGSSQKTRHTVFNVAYFDMESQTIDYETVQDTDANINKLGSVVKNVKAFACTSRSQAHRLGRWFLYNEQNATETCTFTATAEAGVLVRPGQVIQISDPVKSELRRGGLVSSATESAITVDDETNTDLDADNNAKLYVILPDGKLDFRPVSSISGKTIFVNPSFSQTPQANTVWILENDTIQPTTWRIISIKEEGLNYTVTALTHNSSKYAFIEDNANLEQRTITTLTDLKDAPSGVSATEQIVVINNKAVSKLSLSWQSVKGVNQYRLVYRFNNGNSQIFDTQSTDYDILNSNKGVYEVRVLSLNALGEPSIDAATITVNAIGKTERPENVQNLRTELIDSKSIRLRWNQSTDTDVLHGGFCRIRHSPKTDGTGTFQNATDVDKLAGNSTQITVPYVEGEYLLRFEDDGGRLSVNSASIIIDTPDALGNLLVQSKREENSTVSNSFLGAKTNIVRDDSINSLKLTNPATNASGEYEFADILDLGGVFTLDLKRHILSEGFYSGSLFDDRTALIDTWADFDGASATNVNAELLVATTSTAPSGSNYADSDFSGKSFNTFMNGSFTGRGFKFKLILTSSDPAQNIKVSELGYTATFQRRQEQSATAIASGGGVKNISFDKPFFVGTSTLLGANSNLPSIGITALDNITSGDYFQVTNISATGFSVHFKNSSNASIDRNFNFSAVGFGRGV